MEVKMRFFAAFLLASFLFICIGCGASQATGEAEGYLSLTVANQTSEPVLVEIRSENSFGVSLSKTKEILPNEKTILTFPFVEGWNYVFSNQAGKYCKKTFYVVSNRQVIETIGNKKILNEISIRPKDFE